jgi:hypothetical protein
MAKIARKAVFFSIVSIFIVILFTATTELTSKFRIAESEIEVTRTRVKILNSVIKDMEDVYFDRMIYVASKNALVGISKYYYYDNFDNIHHKLFHALNATMKDGKIPRQSGDHVDLLVTGCPSSSPCMETPYTLNNLVEEFVDTFDMMGFEVRQLDIEILGLKQKDPWTIEIEASIAYYFEDSAKTASWRGVTSRKVDVSVYGLYAYDSCLNDGLITTDWKKDTGENQERSVIGKLGKEGPTYKGIMSGDCDDT